MGKEGILKLMFIIILIGLLGVASAETITVCPSECDYDSIQSAIDAAIDNDVIEITDCGTYSHTSQLVITQNGLTIKGTSLDCKPKLEFSDGAYDGLLVQANDVTLENLHFYRNGHTSYNALVGFSNFVWEPFNYTKSDLTVRNCKFEHGRYGLYVRMLGDLTVEDCEFDNTYEDSVVMAGFDGGTANIVSNTFDGTIYAGKKAVLIESASNRDYIQGTINIENNIINKKHNGVVYNFWNDISKLVGLNIVNNQITTISNAIAFYYPVDFSKFSNINIEGNIIHDSKTGVYVDYEGGGLGVPTDGQIVVTNNKFSNINSDPIKDECIDVDGEKAICYYNVDGSTPPGASLDMFSASGNTKLIEVWVDDEGDCGENSPCFDNIQDAIDVVSEGGTVNVAAGTYEEKLDLKSKTLTIEGAGIDTTIVDASSFTLYAIQNFGDSSTIRGLTLIGTGSSTSSYGFKISHVSNVKVENIKVENSYKTGIDLNTVNGATLNNIEVTDTVSGFGLMILDSNDVVVTNITTSGNAWGGVSVQTADSISNLITFSGTFDVGEDAPLLLEKDPPTYHDITNIDIPDKFQYVVYDFRDGGDDYKQWYYFETLDAAKTVAQGFATDSAYSDIIIYDIAEENYYVVEGMLIQDAIDAASDGDTINIDAGTYDEVIDINKRIILQGSGSDNEGTIITKTSITNPAPYPVQVGGVTYSYNPVVIISASGIESNPILLKDIKIEPRQDLVGAARQVPGILLRPGNQGEDYVASYFYIELDNVRVIGTTSEGTPESGVRIDGSTTLNNFVVTDSEFSNMGYGMIFHNNENNPSTVQNIEISNTIFNNNGIKGFYTEKLSDAVFSEVTATNNGKIALSPSWADASNAGIDINLKFGDYQNIFFNNLTLIGNGIDSSNGAGLTIKARGNGDDVSYSSNPATLNNIEIDGGLFVENNIGISFGELNQNNTQPTEINIRNTNIYENVLYGVSNFLSEVIVNAENNWWGTNDGTVIITLVSENVDYTPWAYAEGQYDNENPTTIINSPDANSWQNLDFAVSVSDSDSGGAGLNLDGCYYMVKSKIDDVWQVTKDWTPRTCNAVTPLITVGDGKDCRIQGKDGDYGKCKVHVKSMDNSGNLDETWRFFAIDWTAPLISDLSNYTADGTINNDDDVIISATITDEFAGIKNVWLEGNWENGTLKNYSLTSGNDYYTYLISKNYLENQEIVTWRIYAEDNLGNSVSSSSQEFLVQNRAPDFSGVINDLSWIEDSVPKTVNLTPYFYDLDLDDLDYTATIVSNPGPTSNPIGGITVSIDNNTGMATISSTEDWNGNGTIIFKAWDFVEAYNSSNIVYITVEPDENEIPILTTSISPINFSEDTSIAFDILCDPADSGQTCINYSYDANYINYDENLIVEVDSSTGQVTLSTELDWYGTTYVKFLADDDGTPMQTGSLVAKVNVTPVNDDPILNIPDIEISEDGAFSSINLWDYTTDVDNNLTDMIYTLVSQSNNTLIDCQLNGSLLDCNNPLADAYGISELTIKVEDGSGGFDNQQFIINVTSVNDAPEISGMLGSYSTNEDTPFTINLNNYEYDVDPYDGDAELTWSVSNVDASMISITVESANDMFIVTPKENKNGGTIFDAVLTDSFGEQAIQTITVNITSINDAPVLESIGTQNLSVGKSYSYTVTANDIDNVDLTFLDDTTLFDINPNTGVINFIPANSGEHYVNISVSDGELTDYETVLFNITFENEVPVANNISVITNEDTDVEITLNCTDADVDDVLDYIIVTEPSHGDLSGSGNRGIYSPDQDYCGSDSFTYKCSDGLNESNTATADIIINSVNDAPKIVSYSPVSNPVIREGAQEFSIVAEDFDGPSLTYIWKVDGNVQEATTNSYTYTSISDGEFVISVEVSDGDNTLSHEWVLTVSSVPVTKTFTGDETTNFSEILDLSSASDVILENDYGKIEFLDTLDLSDVFDLDSTIKIEEGVFAIDTSIYPQLNKPARITLTGLSYNSVPEIFYSNQFTINPNEIRNKCDFCTIISYTSFPTTDGIVVFETEHFSSFAVGGSGIKYNLSEFEDLEMCTEGEQGNLIVEIEEPGNGDDFGVRDNIEIEVKVKNGADEDKKIIVEAYLYNIDEDEEVENAESEYEEIRNGRSETFKLKMEVPDDFEEDDNYVLFVKAYEKGDEEVQCNYDVIDVELEREKHDLIISEVGLDSSESYRGGSVELEVKVENIGNEEEEEAYIIVEQESLGISEKGDLFDIEEYGEDDSYSERFRIKIPTTALPGKYDFTIKVVYGSKKDSKLVSIEVLEQVEYAIVKLDTIDLNPSEKLLSVDKKPTTTTTVKKKAIYEPKNPVLTLIIALIIGIIIELFAIAIIKRLRKK